MTEDDSPIKDFYPDSFDIDMNGKKMLWQGVALLPFIDPDRLLEAMSTRYPRLTDVEVVRNTLGHDTLFVSQEHPLYDYLEGLYTKRKIKDVRPPPSPPLSPHKLILLAGGTIGYEAQ
jgi:5'-3' exoribonuclease 2